MSVYDNFSLPILFTYHIRRKNKDRHETTRTQERR